MPDFAKDLEIALDPSTEPEILATLERSPDPTVREAVTCNPNTPAEVLLRLGAEFPAQLLDNPLFTLLILENPNLAAEMPLKTIQSLLQQQNAPAYLWERAGDRAPIEVQLALTARLDTSAQTLQRLMQSKHARVAQAASLHVNITDELGDDWQDKLRSQIDKAADSQNFGSNSPAIYVLCSFAIFPKFLVEYFLQAPKHSDFCHKIAYSVADPNFWEGLANHPDSSVRYALLNNHHVTPDICRSVVLDEEHKLKAARNSTTPAYYLTKLALDPDAKVRQAVAGNTNVPRSLLYDLVKDPDREVTRSAYQKLRELEDNSKNPYDLLSNPKTPTEVVESLLPRHREEALAHPNVPQHYLFEYAQNADWELRKAVASNPNLPLPLIEALAEDDDLDFEKLVRDRIAYHPQTPLKILLKDLARESRLELAVAAQIYPKSSARAKLNGIIDILAEESTSPLEKIVQRLIDDVGVEACQFLAGRSDLPAEFLVRLASHSDLKVREKVAQNQNTPVSALEMLAKDDAVEVRLSVAGRRELSSATVETLVSDRDFQVRQRAAFNPNLSLAAIERILCSSRAFEFLQWHPQCLWLNPEIVPQIVDFYARSQSQLARLIALSQSQVSEEMLAEKSLSIRWLDRLAVARNARTPVSVLQRLTEDANVLVRAAARDAR